ncbi:MAG: hypothetical protein COU07_03140 [Candidatus Harrisonbacteria bacterium CG10_big_fil_rev_8_21_14_0_10_40_38]|uniref:Methyltransferase type 11 domain-containing protein n=1 Tax=Candidatus Harrisonbacteria bacterium CG10_big_fil_rev_8_21_14_0_10_40_38 TaxID=1974583 RepID=A0A2H0URL4_9BACT|nr:MAG: hypothetical protein COU07_03140 [Candidatus Harrisonbacteria bacterium CG10_big_fil_rev_8_21_14_0_10_40_38]
MLNRKIKNTKTFECPVCKKISPEDQKEEFNKYTLWQCGICSVRFWTPFENPGSNWYEHDERYSFRNKNPLTRPERNHRQFLKDSPARNEKLLDIGMGTGNFLAAAKQKGYEVYGIDFDEDAIKTAKEEFGLTNVYVSDVMGIKEKMGKEVFGVATFFEVLEHLSNPYDFLEEVKQIIKPGGYIGLSVPHRECPDFLKKYDKPPRHLTRWNEKSIKYILNQHGFEIVRIHAIRLPIPFLVTKFHFWTRKWTSIGLVSKVSSKNQKLTSEDSGQKKKIKIQKAALLAKIKDYVLFFIPAVFLKIFFTLTRRDKLGLYALAKKK